MERLIKNLNNFQKLLGNINWQRPSLGIPTYALKNVFQTLEGDPSLNSPRQVSPTAENELEIVEDIVNKAQLDRIDFRKFKSYNVVYFTFSSWDFCTRN